MDSFRVVAVDVFAKQACEMFFIHDDHVIEKLSANAADEAFGCAVLPGTWGRRPLWRDLEALDRPGDRG
jgi:hypothetical protein